MRLPTCLLLLVSVVLVSRTLVVGALSSERKLELRDQSKDLFNHGFAAYMHNAFPMVSPDRPLACSRLSETAESWTAKRLSSKRGSEMTLSSPSSLVALVPCSRSIVCPDYCIHSCSQDELRPLSCKGRGPDLACVFP